MKTYGSAGVETPFKAGLKFESNDIRGCKIFKDIKTGSLELYARRSNMVSGWQLKYKGAYWEFCGTIKS